MEADPNESAIVSGLAFSLSAMARGRMLTRSVEDGQQREHDRPADHDVQHQHGRAEPPRQLGQPARQLAGHAASEEGDDEEDEPTHACPGGAEDEGAQQAQDAPQTNRAGGDEAASWEH